MNRKVRTALYACALMAPLLLQSCNAQSEKKESNKECTEETNKNTEKKGYEKQVVKTSFLQKAKNGNLQAKV